MWKLMSVVLLAVSACGDVPWKPAPSKGKQDAGTPPPVPEPPKKAAVPATPITFAGCHVTKESTNQTICSRGTTAAICCPLVVTGSVLCSLGCGVVSLKDANAMSPRRPAPKE